MLRSVTSPDWQKPFLFTDHFKEPDALKRPLSIKDEAFDIGTAMITLSKYTSQNIQVMEVCWWNNSVSSK